MAIKDETVATLFDRGLAVGIKDATADLGRPSRLRALCGPDFARLIPAAALFGGGFLLVIDTLARTMAPVEIPLGILTAVIGTPFFIWLLASVSKTWS